MWDINEFAAISIKLASPERIREWSHGEVKKPETINYRTLKPELDGLFCERIFGSTKDWECYCGKFKSIRYKGVVCDRCQVEVTHSKVRRERMGHIDLVAPVSHIWFFKGIPSRMGVLLGISVRALERVLYFQDYIITDPGDTPLKKKALLTEDEYREAFEKYGTAFRADMGAEAVKELLKEMDLDTMSMEIRELLKLKPSKQEERQLIRQLAAVEAFLKSGNKPEWMILEAVPVIPPELRPMVQLDGGRFATSDLNDLYRRVINRNNRLKRLMDLKAPAIIVRNEKRMLQEAVDALFDNGRRGRSVKGASNNRVLKSLSDMLKGKQGRFRQNLLGKRVDYSGRSVIVVGPELRLNECGIPKKMILELFKPFIMRELVKRGLSTNIKAAKRSVERASSEVWEVVEDVIRNHPVLLNRAPTLHRLGIQAFYPKLVEGKAIRVHPLVCAAFNADFDGDQMAVHVPLSAEAISEAHILMLSSLNILSPANGRPIVSPTQDIVMGIYYLTKERESRSATQRVFSSFDETLRALESGVISIHSRTRVRVRKGEIIETTPGRIIFNSILPSGYDYQNKTLSKKDLSVIMDRVYREYGASVAALTADRIKNLGFEYATKSGLSIGIEDLKVPDQKGGLISEAMTGVDKIQTQYNKGILTDQERYTKVIEYWSHTTDKVADALFDEIEMDNEGFNPIHAMSDSGARGSKVQIKQLAGMRGLMADPFGKIRETPIISNFREGLSVIEFFQSTNGARKGLTDTALKTANAGYLTRRLVDVAQDVIVTENDCGTARGILTSSKRRSESLSEIVLGRIAADDIEDPRSGKVFLKAGEEIGEEAARVIAEAGIDEVMVRSVLTCESQHGVCRLCYGRDLATGRLVEIGEAVGVIAAQSIGEPGTQLTLRTFHIGGTAAADDTFLRALFSCEISKVPLHKPQADGTDIITEESPFLGFKKEVLEISSGAVLHRTVKGKRLEQTVDKHASVRVPVSNSKEVSVGDELVVVEAASPESGTVASIYKGTILLKSGKKERTVSVPVGLKVSVALGARLKKGDVVAKRAFIAGFAGKISITKSRSSTTISLLSVAEEPVSAVLEEGQLVSSSAMLGTEPNVSKGDVVSAGDIIGTNPSYSAVITAKSGSISFKRLAVQEEGKDHIVTRPDWAEGDEQASAIIWAGEDYIIGPEEEPLVKNGARVSKGDPLSPSVVSRSDGTVCFIRRYSPRRGGGSVTVARVVESSDRKSLPYLRYTRTAAGTSKSRTLSKTKKQNIRLISRCHIVDMEKIRSFEKIRDGFDAKLSDLRIMPSNRAGAAESDLFDLTEYSVPTTKVLADVVALEEKRTLEESGMKVEKGVLLAKNFSDFIKGPKEASGERSGMAKDITGGLPRVEELFELRKSKATPAVLAPISGTVGIGSKFRKSRTVEINLELDEADDADAADSVELKIPPERHLIYADGEEIEAGDRLTDGPVDPHELLKVKGEIAVEEYVVQEVQDVYRMQGVDIDNKHLEVIVRQMMRKQQVEDPGETDFLPEEMVDRSRLNLENRRVAEAGKTPARARPILLGITKAAKYSESFISAASFQETTWALTQASMMGKRDELVGLKENVIIGHLIPAGTGFKRYRQISLGIPDPEPQTLTGDEPAAEGKAAASAGESPKAVSETASS